MIMEKNKEELAVPLTSDETLSDIRELSIRCRELLHQLSADDGPADGAEARELMAGFNIWAANMGVFRDGQQSLTSRLKNAPQICELVQQLLMVLERDLEKEIIQGGGQEGSSSASESENSSDRSSTSSYRLLSPSDDDKDLPSPPPPQPTIRTSIHDIITSLRQLALTVRLAGARHREERIQRFKNLDRNKQVYQVVKKFARQMVDFRFDKASESLRERMAESIATRRARFLYLEQHQKKTSTLNEPAPTLQQMAPEEEEYTPPAIQPEQQQAATVLPPQKDHLGPSVRASVMLSATDRTELDLKQVQAAPNKTKRAESVSSVKIAMGTLPSIPKLDPGGLSFTCPYCFLVCPAKEASGQKQWLSHLIHDFEPFFCVFDDCSSPLTCAATYSGWLAHMRDRHTQPEWHCWHCKTTSQFSNPADLEKHLKKHHKNEVTESLRPTLVKHSMVRDQHPLQDCPFCGGFPEEIEKDHPDRDSKKAREALEKHVRDHLISVALILAPVKTEEPGIELDDTQSEAQRGSESERDLDDVSDTYELRCRNRSCDCRESKKSSVFDWSKAPGHQALEMKDMETVTQLWKDILDEKSRHQREDETMLDVAAKFGQNSTRIEHTGGKFTPEQREATIWAPLHTQRRPSTMEPLYAQLNKSLRTCPLEARFPKFLPLDELEKVTLENIQAELPMTTQLFSPGLPHKVASEAKRVFCILVLMEEAAAIAQLIKEGITDEDLPLCRNDDDENDSEYNVLASVGSNKRFPSTMSWGQGVQVENFLKKQWVVQSPIFDKPGSHLVLDPECALPLTECETEHAKGDMSVVHKAKLHPAHQHIFPADAEAYVAIKEFHKKEVFTREKDNLDIIQRLQNGHLIPLLASCERGSTYYLLFPWANGGTLRDFWGEHDCKPRTTGLIRWALEQILGLVDGIRALHNHNIRHGDIKPQNILVFEEHQGANLATLVLADMGGSKFHKEATDLRSSATMTAESTVSYEAPETDDDQQNNTPRPRRYDMWSAGCMFLEFTVWLVYDFAAVNGFHKKRKDQNDPVSPGNFFSREPGQSTRIHPAVTEAVRHLRKHPLCKHGTALGDLVAVINDRLLQIKPADRALAPELYDRVKTIVDAAAAKPEYLGQEVKPPLPTPEFFSPPGSRKGSSS